MSLLGWVFGKKRSKEHAARQALTQELGHWRIIELRTEDGLQAVARTRLQRPDLPNLPSFTTAISVCWAYRSEDGFPDAETTSAMDRFELVMDDLSDCDFSYLIQVRTGHDERAWLYYTADRERFLTELQRRAIAAGGPPIRAEAVDDPEWTQWSLLVQKTVGAGEFTNR